jgi:hypothetical protein
VHGPPGIEAELPLIDHVIPVAAEYVNAAQYTVEANF